MIITKEKYKDTHIVYIDERRVDMNELFSIEEDYDNPNIPLSIVDTRLTLLRQREPIYP